LNGELADERWAFFISFDWLLVWICAFASCGFLRGYVWRRRRQRASSRQAPSV
jgi:hypothetical protein